MWTNLTDVANDYLFHKEDLLLFAKRENIRNKFSIVNEEILTSAIKEFVKDAITYGVATLPRPS